MKTSILFLAFFICAICVPAQSVPPPQQQDSSIVGLAPGESARLNVLYPTVPVPVLQPICTVSLIIADDQGNVLKNLADVPILGGKAVSLTLNADTDLSATQGRAQIRGFSLTPATSSVGGYCRLIPSLDIVDNSTGRTLLHLETRITFRETAPTRMR